MIATSTASKDELSLNQPTFPSNKSPHTLLPFIIVFCLPLLLYVQTLRFGFTQFDDNLIIVNNIGFLSDFSNAPQAFLKDAFLENKTPLYRPLQTLSYMADMHLSGANNTWMYHLTNVMLLGFIACALFAFFRAFLIPPRAAILTTLLYCVHPLFISSVAWIPARGDLMLSLFSLLSLLSFMEFLRQGKALYLFLNWLTFTIALFCKETAVVLPFLFIIYYISFASSRPFPNKSALTILLLYTISATSWFALRSMAIGYSTIQNHVALSVLMANLRVIPESLTSFFLPVDIAPVPHFSLPRALAGFGVIAAIIVLLLCKSERTRREKMFGLSWFLLLLLPTLLYKVAFTDFLNHRFFVPLIGIALFVLLILPKKWLETKDVRTLWLMVAILGVLCFTTFVQSRPYSNPMAFYNFAILQNQGNALLYNNRGYIERNSGDIEGAIGDYTKAIELNPHFALAYYGLGGTYHTKGDLDNAIANYGKAIELKDSDKAVNPKPNYELVYCNRATVYSVEGDMENAIKDYDKAIEVNPRYAIAYINRGTIYRSKGDMENAIKNYDKAIELKPNYAVAYYNRGVAYAAEDDLERAISDYDKTIELNPDYANAYYNRGIARNAKGMSEEAERDLKMYEELKMR